MIGPELLRVSPSVGKSKELAILCVIEPQKCNGNGENREGGMPLRQPRILAEIGGALVEKRLFSFGPFFGHVVEQGGISGQFL